MHSSDICPFCGQNGGRVIRLVADWYGSETFSIRECPSCAFRFTDPVPSESEIGKYYETDKYVPLSTNSAGAVERFARVVRMIRNPLKMRLIRKVTGKTTGTLLDIGSATGEFLLNAKNAGWTTTGIEPNDRARSHSIAAGLDVRPQQELKALPSDAFDVVTMWHVLEHVHDVRGTLNDVRRVLKPDGVAVFAVPNSDCMEAESYEDEWFAFDTPRHLSHFTPATLKRWTDEAKLETIGLRGMILDAAYICYRSEKQQKRNIVRAIPVALRSMWQGWWNPRRCSVILVTVRKRP
jgi:2-polyprenyl-3-methyl-5-hydroxy-6-metoxy-1,4-benzoquinol methylase